MTRTKFAIAIALATLLGSTVAFAATHPFDDVPRVGDSDERFFSEPVQWAWENGLTTGSPGGSDTFKPFDAVTRGENITFNHRYDTNVVQPALNTLTTDIAANAGAISGNSAAIASNDTDIATNTAAIDAHIGQTHTITVGGPDFRSLSHTASFTFDGLAPGGFYGSGTKVAPLHLPDGATIESVTMHFYDAGASSATAWISREELASGTFSLVTSSPASTGTSGHQSIAATVATSGEQIIMADMYNYMVAAVAPSTAERVVGVTVTYTAAD